MIFSCLRIAEYSRLCWGLLLPLLLVLTACEDNSVDPVLYGTVQGTVRDARTNQLLSNVSITTTPATSSLVTDAQGAFELTNAPIGRLTIVGSKADYQQTSVAVTVDEGKATVVTILLGKAASAAPPSAPARPQPADQAIVPGPDVKLEWHPVNATRADSLRYDVTLYEGSNGSSRALLTNSRDTTVTTTGLRYNTTYFWQVTVRNGNGGSARSNLWSFRTGALPDNRYLFAREVNGNTDIYSTNEAGTSLQQLTSSAFIETAPQLSPNRDRIAYASNATGQFQIYTMNRDGSDVRQVTLLPVDGYFNQGIGYRWSPDGAQLIYSSYDKLYRINRDGTGLTLLATAPADRHFRECDWTAQGNRMLVQTVGISVYDSELYLLNADGSNRTLLVGNVPGRLDSPSFSVDGKRVMYTRDVDGFNDLLGRQLNAHIFTQNLDGSGLVDVSAGTTGSGTNSGKPLGFNDVTPRYSPDGARIIFVQVNNVLNSTPDVYTAELDGRTRTRLFQNASLPDWR
jgi:TolB protein